MKNEIQVSSKEQTEKQMVNPFPNVRMVVKDGKQLWCLKDFAIAIGFTGNNPSGSALKLLNDVEKRSCSDVEQVQFEGERQVNRKMSYVPIELLNAIINRTTLKTPSVTEWRTKMQQVGGEAVKSQLGIENDIDKMVNERVEKALALQNNNSATIALCNNMTMLLAKFDEDSKRRDEENKRRDEENKRRDEENKRFYAELFGKTNKLEDKVVTVNPYKFSMTEIATYIPGQNATTLNRMLLAHEYLYKKNGVYYPTERMKELGYYTDLCNKYHTPVYKVEMIDFMKQLVREDKQELADKKE